MIARIREPIDPASVDVYVEHRCPDFVSGTAHGPYGTVSAWSAVSAADGWAIRLLSPQGRLPAIVAAISVELGESRADRLRRFQDEAAEALD